MKRTWSQANAQQYGQLGIIESVRLRNFMCHDNLSFDFDPHMNFIVGLNGSGKSAILTGIILALGGKSGATGRYTNIKGFVKTGKNSALVSVTLKNCGPDAYKPDEYGEKITVERQLTADGVSNYKIKSEAGRILSNSKEELTNILSVMDIQVENPITVLTQDISKNFLVSKNSKADKLFKLFYQGTGLSRIHDSYNRSLSQKEDAKSELEKKKAILPDMEKEVKTLKALLDKSLKIAELRKELCWAMVIEFEMKRDAEVKCLERLKKDEADLNKNLKISQDRIDSIAQSVVTAQADKRTSNQKIESIRKELQELISKRDALKSEIRETQGTSSRHEREVKKIESEITSLEKIMSDIKMKNENDMNEDKLNHENTVKNLKNQITNTRGLIDMKVANKNSLQETTSSLQKEVDSCHAELVEISYEKTRILKQKQQLIDGMKNRINVFGREMILVLQEINVAAQAGIFKKSPKGPIGAFVTVKHSEWNFAVQECLKMSFLKTFLCDNHADAEQLTKIFNKHYGRHQPSIITTKFVSEVYDVSAYKTVCQYPTLFDILNIEDPVITNCLIDQRQIENILMVSDTVEARQLMLYNPPTNCLFAYSLNGDQFCHSPFRKYSCRNKNKFSVLKTVNEDDIRIKNEETASLEVITANKTAHKEDLLQQLKSNEKNILLLNNEITALKINLNQLHMAVQDEENAFSEPKDISCLHSDLEELEKDKMNHQEILNSSKAEIASKMEELNNLASKIEECKKILEVESSNFHGLSEKLRSFENEKEKLDSGIKKIESRLVQIAPLCKEKEKSVADCEGTIKIATKRGLSACPRIDTKRSSETVKELLNEMERFIQNQKNCDRETLINEYEDKIQALNKAKAELIRQQNINQRLDKMLALRFQEFQKICKNTSISLTCTFTSLLKENNFVGYPDVNFSSRTLEIIAKPDKRASKTRNKTHLTQLSGGERSFVTIAFLLSLWDRIHMPFRILDEYDVFMDFNNRHLSIHLLINTAKANKKIQYIFMSPLELPHIEDCDHIKVHKMPAPRK